MVTKGQFLERPTLIPTSGGLVLEGLSHRGEQRPGLLVVPPPPFEGGGMDHVVAAELAFAVSRLGFPTLRFNFAGVGASQGEPVSSLAQLERLFADACAALELAADNARGAAPVVVSLGGSDVLAARLSRQRVVSAVAFIDPSLPEAERALSVPVCVLHSEARLGNLTALGRAVAALLVRVGGVSPNP